MDEALQQLKDWILKKHPDRADIPGDLDLIENRLIDSLSFVEFLFLLEQLSGRSIDMDAVDIETLRCLDIISERYLAVT